MSRSDMTARPSQASAGAGRAATPDPHRRNTGNRNSLAAWAELLRLPALFTVPGDALAGAAAVSAHPDLRTVLAIGSSLCLYEAGMALNDWADRDEDAAERPHRPLPSGRIRPTEAFIAACACTAAGLTLASRAGRPALAVAVPLAATVWAYDLILKRTPAGPAAMAAARGLDLLLGAAATAGRTRPALRPAVLLSTHTLAVTTVSRHETRGGSPVAPLAALAATGVLTWRLTRPRAAVFPGRSPADDTVPRQAPSASARGDLLERPRVRDTAGHALRAALAAAYATTAARPCFHATLNPSPPLTQRAVGAGIRAMIPLQAALSARAGAPAAALFTAALAPLAAKFGRKVSLT
ncbi:SCO3242 family prenyltransferase [Streptomyces yaanensis]|uniref:SCO3242 family prenyltransferase n=1 Tax=Streptomyces yaanensis TaxID=1142239 RepID=A0ABV7SCW9_9ACTN|nr:UbiA family prenyltransferase [Streptomyces sp. CGMCC 4.7035]WNB98985.1 UbiA family prenyltransferase [Streptomyces sp. CGMCC 4.7035]